MRIVVDLQSCQNTSRLRGIGRYAMAITRALLSIGTDHDIRIVLSDRFPETIGPIRAGLGDLITQDRIHVFHVPASVAGAEPESAWRSHAAEALREHFLAALRPDAVFLPSLFEGYHDDCVTSIGRQPIPTAVALHDLIPLLWPGNYITDPEERACYDRKLLSLIRADLWLPVSNSAAREASTLLGLPEDRMVVTLEAVEEKFQRIEHTPAQKRAIEKRFRLSRPFLMFANAGEHRKNFDGLVHAFARLPADVRRGHQIVIVGAVDDDARDHVEAVTRGAGLHPDEWVLTGRVSDDELIDLYNLCQLFVFPSFHEGFGLPLLEAMACGAPVIGSNVSSIPEVIGRDDALFDPRDAAAMAALINRALTDAPFNAELRAHGLKRVKQFSWERSARKVLEGLERLSTPKPLAAAERPRLAYVCALPPTDTVPSRRAQALLPHLAAYYEIDLICDQPHIAAPWLTANLPIRSRAWFLDQADAFDHVVYDLGGEAGAIELLTRRPGVVVLDELFIRDTRSELDDRAFLPWVCETQGYDAALLATDKSRTSVAATYPLIQEALEASAGVVVADERVMAQAKPWFDSETLAHWRRLASSDRGESAMADSLRAAIEAFARTGPAALKARLFADLARHTAAPPSQADVAEVVRSMTANMRPPGRARLLVDVSGAAHLRPWTSEWRATAARFAKQVREGAPTHRLEPLYLDGDGFRHARAFAAASLDLPLAYQEDERLQVFPGDRLLVADPAPASHVHALAKLRDEGVEIVATPVDAEPRPDFSFVVRGHVLGTYSLAMINRAVARALDRDRPGRVRFEGVENGPVASLAAVPEPERQAVETMTRRSTPEGPTIAISQHYPVLPPPNGAGLSLALLAWEESLAPADMIRTLSNGYDAVLATSSFTAKALIDSGLTIPAVSIGQPPDISAFADLRRVERRPGDPFVFLHVSSAFPRKGLDVLLAAWARAFRRADRVRLVIKTFPNPHNEAAAQIAALRRKHPDCAEIELIDQDIDAPALLDLYRRADAVVSPSRGEGYNLPALEAMAAGIPLIVTGHGGHLDFCGPDNARLIRHRMAPSQSHVAAAHALWAEPDEDDLVAALREMLDPDFAPAIAERSSRARRTALAAVDPRLWVNRLERLAASLSNETPRRAARLAWVSTWSTRCGIAEYSRLLLDRFSPATRKAMTVICDHRTARGVHDGLQAKPAWTIGAPAAWRPIAEAIDESDADVVVIQHQAGLIPWDELSDLLADPRLTARVSVVMLHNAVHLPMITEVERERTASSLKRASRVLVHTLRDLNLLLDLGVQDNVTLLPHGAAKPAHVPPIRELRPASSAPLLGCHGFFLPGKGIGQVIRACAALRSIWPGLRLRLVTARFPDGVSDREIEECQQLAHDLGMTDAIDWHLTFLSVDEISRLLGECDLVVMAYEERTDSASGAVRTALSSLAPVLATRVAIFAELDGAVGWIDSNKPSAIAAAIDTHLRDAERRRRIQMGAARWLDTYEWSVVASRMEGMIEGLVRARRLQDPAPAPVIAIRGEMAESFVQ